MSALTETESIEEFEQVAAELEIDFEDYYQREQQLHQQLPTESNVKLLRAIKHFLTKERTSPFSLDVPSDFAIAQWGI